MSHKARELIEDATILLRGATLPSAWATEAARLLTGLCSEVERLLAVVSDPEQPLRDSTEFGPFEWEGRSPRYRAHIEVAVILEVMGRITRDWSWEVDVRTFPGGDWETVGSGVSVSAERAREEATDFVQKAFETFGRYQEPSWDIRDFLDGEGRLRGSPGRVSASLPAVLTSGSGLSFSRAAGEAGDEILIQAGVWPHDARFRIRWFNPKTQVFELEWFDEEIEVEERRDAAKTALGEGTLE